jgi:hypothetical protein
MADRGALKLTRGHEAQEFGKVESELLSNSSTKGLTNPPNKRSNNSQRTYFIGAYSPDLMEKLTNPLEERAACPRRSATGHHHSTQREGNCGGDSPPSLCPSSALPLPLRPG